MEVAVSGKVRAPAQKAFAKQQHDAIGDEAGESLVKLLDVLDDHDDVQNVYGNYELSDALLRKLDRNDPSYRN